MKIEHSGSLTPSLLATVAMLVLAGCNTGPTLQEGGSPQDPNREVYRMSRVVDEMNQGLQRDRMVASDMNQRMSLLEGEIRQLRGTVDELRHENTKLRDQAAVTHAPVTAPPPAMAPISAGGPAMTPPAVTEGAKPPLTPPASMAAPSPAAASATAAKATDPNAPMRIVVGPGGVATPAPAQPPATTQPPAATPPAAAKAVPPPATSGSSSGGQTPPPASASQQPTTPEKSYDEAFVLLKSGQYDKAMPAFENFVKTHPQHDLADNSQYWIGEMHYVQRRFPDALVAFNKVLVDWPNSDKVPGSMLKIGLSFYELEDMANAKSTLERLIKEYPDSSAITPAKQRLKLIQQKQANP